MRTFLRLAVPVALVTMAAAAQTTKENQVKDRGQVPVEGGAGSLASNRITLAGMLVDAGCRDRTALNLGLAPESIAAAGPAQTQAEAQSGAATRAQQGYATPGSARPNPQISAQGITVDAKTIEAERADVIAHQVPDLRSRQMDPTCAITGATHSFAILLDSGRFLNLDDGGNTLATEAVQGSAQGRAMLSGNGSGFKPRGTVNGRIRADKVIVDSLKVK